RSGGVFLLMEPAGAEPPFAPGFDAWKKGQPSQHKYEDWRRFWSRVKALIGHDYGFLGDPPDNQNRIGDGLSAMQWVGLLTNAGFESIDILLRDAEKVVLASVKPYDHGHRQIRTSRIRKRELSGASFVCGRNCCKSDSCTWDSLVQTSGRRFQPCFSLSRKIAPRPRQEWPLQDGGSSPSREWSFTAPSGSRSLHGAHRERYLADAGRGAASPGRSPMDQRTMS